MSASVYLYVCPYVCEINISLHIFTSVSGISIIDVNDFVILIKNRFWGLLISFLGALVIGWTVGVSKLWVIYFVIITVICFTYYYCPFYLLDLFVCVNMCFILYFQMFTGDKLGYLAIVQWNLYVNLYIIINAF